jgi:broad specificity phosphatase PhoE
MSDALPIVYLARHGETAWSLSGQHTGLTDLPLTAAGERNAADLGRRMRGVVHQRVLTSPLARARRTCELAGFGAGVEVDVDLVEWNYGDYEGLRSVEILAKRPGWKLFRDGCPGGESPADVMARARRVVARLRAAPGNTIVFSSGHFLRMLTASWLGLEPQAGALWILGTTSLSALGYEHDPTEPVIRFWNDMPRDLTGHGH